jgi:hypothetical protein
LHSTQLKVSAVRRLAETGSLRLATIRFPIEDTLAPVKTGAQLDSFIFLADHGLGAL